MSLTLLWRKKPKTSQIKHQPKALLILSVSLLCGVFLFSSHVAAITIQNPSDFPNDTTDNVPKPTGTNSDFPSSVSNAADEVGNAPINEQFALFRMDGSASPSATSPATRSEGLSDTESDFEVVMPYYSVNTQSPDTVTIVDACKAVKDSNGWEDHGYNNSLITPNTMASASNSTSTTCSAEGSSGNLTIDIKNAFQLDSRYGSGMESAIVRVTDGNASKDNKKIFTVQGPYGSFVSPPAVSPYGSTTPTAYNATNIENPATDYFYAPSGSCSGSAPGNCSADEDNGYAAGGYGSMNEPSNSDKAQGSVYKSDGTTPNCTNPSTLGSANACATSSAVNSFNFYFSPDCSYDTTQPVYLKWDRGNPSGNTQLDTETWTLYDGNTPMPGLSNIKVAANSPAGGGPISYDVGKLTPGDVYHWQWNNVDRAHGVAIWLPFDEYTATSAFQPSQCNWSLNGHSSVSPTPIGTGQATTFTHYVTNNGPNSASYSWDVEGNYFNYNESTHALNGGSGWSPSHCGDNSTGNQTIISQSDGTSCPNLMSGAVPNGTYDGSVGNGPVHTIRYMFPSNAQNGDEYCQRLEFTHKAGPSDTSTTEGSSVCVTYDSSTAGVTNVCSSLYQNLGNETYTDPDGNAVSIHEDVTVTDSQGNVLVDGHLDNQAGSTDNKAETWNYTPLGQSITIKLVYSYHDSGLHTYETDYLTSSDTKTTTATSIPCYSAACTTSVSAPGVAVSSSPSLPDGALPTNGVVAGGNFTVTVTLYNNGGSWELPLPSTLGAAGPLQIDYGDSGGNKNPAGSMPAGGDFGDFSKAAPSDVPIGGSEVVSFPVAAPSAIQAMSIWAHATYNDFNFGTDCYGDVNTYAPFSVTPYANAQYDSNEDPTIVKYDTYGTTSGNPASVYVPTTSCFYELSDASSCSGGTYINGTPIGPGTAPNNQSYATSGNTYTQQDGSASDHMITYDIPSSVNIAAGLTYCSEIYMQYTAGYVGPGGPTDVGDTNTPQDSKDCPEVVNRPYFKVYGSGVSAGGDFTSESGGDSCGSGDDGGTLASWNDNSNTSPAYDFGASAQFNALALNNIILGFASAQRGDPARAPNELSFANGNGTTATNYSQVSYNPPLGGKFGGSQCLTNVTAPSELTATPLTGTTTVPVPSPSASSSPVQETYSFGSGAGSQLTLTDGASAIKDGNNMSIFVKGDVYINSNITYADTSWSNNLDGTNNVPSFILHATGNIYIAPGVTQLDGVYIADGNDGTAATTTGNIYTCSDSTGFAPMAAASLFGSCNNQLVVNGEFEANHVDLMRTYGSLRDEKPVPAGTYGRPSLGTTYGPSVYLPLASDSDSEGLYLSENSYGDKLYTTTESEAEGSPYFFTPDGSPGYIINPSDPDPPSGTIRLYRGHQDSDPYNHCITIYSNDSDGCTVELVLGYVYTTDTMPGGPPNLSAGCDNSTPADAQDDETCAAEVFNFSPELYLSTPAIDSGEGAPKYQAVTSLPPVL
jgi:hypothetical protein